MGPLYRLRLLGALHARRHLPLAEVFARIVGRLSSDCAPSLRIVRADSLLPLWYPHRMTRHTKKALPEGHQLPFAKFNVCPGQHNIPHVSKKWECSLYPWKHRVVLAEIFDRQIFLLNKFTGRNCP